MPRAGNTPTVFEDSNGRPNFAGFVPDNACLMHGTSGNFTRLSKENKKQDMLFYDAYLVLSHLRAPVSYTHLTLPTKA